MRPCAVIFFTLLFMGSWLLTANADKLYTWTDDKGEWHISQTPPPEDGQLKDVIKYTPHPSQRSRPDRPTMDIPDDLPPEADLRPADKPPPDPAVTDENPEIEVRNDYDPDLRREKIKEEIKEKLEKRPTPYSQNDLTDEKNPGHSNDLENQQNNPDVSDREPTIRHRRHKRIR